MNKDRYLLSRFIEAQKIYYETAYNEIKNGLKISHWMWFVFPMISGIGTSSMCKKYEIKSLLEAEEYLKNDYLGNNLRNITQRVIDTVKESSRHPYCIFGDIDNKKLLSCWTLFYMASETENDKKLFKNAISTCYGANVMCKKTLEIINNSKK